MEDDEWVDDEPEDDVKDYSNVPITIELNFEIIHETFNRSIPTMFSYRAFETLEKLKEDIKLLLQSEQAVKEAFLKMKVGIREVRNHHEEYVLKESNIMFVEDFIDKSAKEDLGIDMEDKK
jgi:hypothetical protein